MEDACASHEKIYVFNINPNIKTGVNWKSISWGMAENTINKVATENLAKLESNKGRNNVV